MTYRNAYPIRKFSVTYRQYEYVQDLLRNQTPENVSFFSHILANSVLRLRREDDQDWIPMYCLFIRRHFRSAEWGRLVDDELLDYEEYNYPQGICRRFKVKTCILQHFIEIADPLDRRVNLIDGRRMTHPVLPRLTNDQRNEWEGIIHNVQQFWRTASCPVNLQAMGDFVELRRIEYQKSENEKQRRRYILDSNTWARLHGQLVPDNPSEFIHDYRPVSTGRLAESAGPLLCTRSLVKAMFHDIPVKNYDISASQDCCLELLFTTINRSLGESHLNIDPVREFSGNKEGRRRIAEEIGIDSPTLKRMIHALKMGAMLRWRTESPSAQETRFRECYGGTESNDLDRILREYVSSTHENPDNTQTVEQLEEIMRPIHDRFRERTSDLRRELRKFHKAITSVENLRIMDDPIFSASVRDQRITVLNACGVRYTCDMLSSQIDPCKLSAFLLQGLEAAFIHHLTIESQNHEFRPVANAHDGLLTIREIPQHAIDSARHSSGFTNANLIEKEMELTEGDEQLWERFTGNTGTSTLLVASGM